MMILLPISVISLPRAAICLAVALASLPVDRRPAACEAAPDLRIEVMSKFDSTAIRTDYTLADIAALARQQHHEANRTLLGFYSGAFGYSVGVAAEPDQACPTQVLTTVTLRLQHRLIEIGQEAATNSCVYELALRHYQRLAEADEQTVERFSARAAAMLAQASAALKQSFVPGVGLDAALREQIRVVMDQAIEPLHDARLDAQEAVNTAGKLKQLASSCAI